MKRRLYENIWSRLSKYGKMMFISGPRQAGKTTFAKMVAKNYTNFLYFNWDILADKQKLIQNPQFYERVQRNDDSRPLIILDELHKYPDWKNYLKGIYDKDRNNFIFLVSGSGRMDIYQKGGDSLAGRYIQIHMWPFTLSELAGHNLDFKQFLKKPIAVYDHNKNTTRTIWERLEKFSGFPDPYLNADHEFCQIWSNSYKRQLIREDVRDFAALRQTEKVEMLFALLSSKVGSPLSMSSLAEDIQVSFDSIKGWLELFDNFYLSFRISPWTQKISRAITREKKLYLFDYSEIDSKAVRFENMAAIELYRAVSNWNDLGLGQFSLHYIRNREKQEVDFLIANRYKPFILIETKLSEHNAIKNLRKFQKILEIPSVLLVHEPDVCKIISNGHFKIMVISADHWLSLLP